MKIENINSSHLDDLSKIVNRNWNFEKYGISPEDNLIFSKLDLYDCLRKSNYSKVAIIDNKPVGYIIGRDFNRARTFKWDYLKYLIKPLHEQLKTSPNFKLLEDFTEIYKVTNKALKANAGKEFDSELIFFGVDPDYQGKGIGSQLMEDFYKFLKKNELHSLYVFTDTNCNYNYYENDNFTRFGQILRNPLLIDNNDLEFYLYYKKM